MKILIADDHILFRDTLNHYIRRAQPTYKLYMASNLHEVVDVLKARKFIPDLCLIDFRMPGMQGCESFEQLVKKYPEFSFAVMSGIAGREEIEKILSLGISGFIPKTMSGRNMLQAIDVMLNGQRFFPQDEESYLSAGYYGDYNGQRIARFAASRASSLTAREKEVLRLLCQGKSNQDIANDLTLKIVTVKLHVRGIFRKLGCSNRTQAVLKSKELGMM